MPRGLSAPIKTELNATTFGLPIYCVRVQRASTGETWRWADRAVTFNDGILASAAYEARLAGLPMLTFTPDQAEAISLTLSNVDDLITGLDRLRSFLGSKVDVLAYLPNIDQYYIVWSGWADDIAEFTQEQAVFRAYPTAATPNLQVPGRAIGLPCTNQFANTALWVSARDFEGSECPYGRTSTIGFQSTLNATINATATSVAVVFTTAQVGQGAALAVGDLLQLESELALVTAIAGAPSGSTGVQNVTVQRGVRQTTPASHTTGTVSKFANCSFGVNDCKRRGMYGNNSVDTYGAGIKRNYFAGFPFVLGYQYGNYRSKSGERTQPLRLVFSGNDSAYGRTLSLVYGRARVADPICLLAKPEGDFLTTLWAVAEGVLATNATDDTQTTPSDAYCKTVGGDGFSVENIYVNGRSRHDRQPNFGIEIANGEQDRPQPAAAFFPTDPTDFVSNSLGFWGTARVTMRISQKDNPTVDFTNQSVGATMEVRWGRVHRIYTGASPLTYVRRATDNGSSPGANPVWVLMDLMASKRAGAGLDYDRFNIQSFIDAAAYCSATITNVFDGTPTKRWTFNGVIDQRKALAEWMNLLSTSMYSLIPFQDANGLLKIKMLKAETLSGVPLFSSLAATPTGRAIVWEGNRSTLTKSRQSAAMIPNEVRINYIDKSYDAGFSATLNAPINDSSDPVTATVHWNAAAIAAGVRFVRDDKVIIDKEKLWITFPPNPPDGSGNQSLFMQRAYGGTTKATHPSGSIVQFIGAGYSRISMVVADRDAAQNFGKALGDQTRRVLTKTYDLPGVTTLDEAARLGTLILRAGEFGRGGLANNLTISFKTFYRLAEDLEIGDIIQVEDALLDAANNETYFRITSLASEPQQLNGGGYTFMKTVTAVLHDNAIYDDTAFTVSDYTRIDSGSPTDGQPPAVTNFTVVESGLVDSNGKLTTRLTINYIEPSPLDNFRSVIIYRSSDDGAGNPVGDWRVIAEVFESGVEIEDEVTGEYEWYAAVSRAMSGHHGNVDAIGPDGNPVYPMVRILVDGMADTLLAPPTGLQAFGRESRIYLTWNAYTSVQQHVFKRFNVYRNTTNNSATATLIANTDTNWFEDVADTVIGSPASTFYYWVRGVSKLEGVTINSVVQDGLSGFSAVASDNPGTDTGSPDAPVINVLHDVSYSDGNYAFVIGVDAPASPTNWDTVEDTQIQVATDAAFTAIAFDRTFALTRPPFTYQFNVRNSEAGTYYFRARVQNIFGWSVYSATFTRATDPVNATGDTNIIPVPANVSVMIAGTGNDLTGTEILVEFDLPATQRETYWAYNIHLHDSATIPPPDVDAANSNYAVTGTTPTGHIVTGSNLLTDSTKSFSGLVGRRIMVFSPKRPTTGAWSEEGAIHLATIQGSSGTTLTLDQPMRMTGTVQYYVLTGSPVGQDTFEKFIYDKVYTDYDPSPTKITKTARRSVRIQTAMTNFWFSMNLFNIFGAGKLTTPVAVTITGLTITGDVPFDNIIGDGVGPGAPTSLTAASGFRMIFLNWGLAANSDLKGTEIWRATVNNRASAILVGTVGLPLHMWSDDNLSTGTQYWYWVRHTDYDGLTGNYFPASATAGITATATSSGQTVVAAEIAAGAVTATQINVSALSAITANMGALEAGTITMIGPGATFIKTATSGARIELDNVNGLRAYDASSVLTTQIAITGTNPATVRTLQVAGLNSILSLTDASNFSNLQIDGSGAVAQFKFFTNSIGRMTISSNEVFVTNIPLMLSDGQSLRNNTGNASISLDAASSGQVMLKTGGVTRLNVASTGLFVTSGLNIQMAPGNGIQDNTGDSAIAFATNELKFYTGTGSIERARLDTTSSTTLLPLWLYKNGTLTQLTYDNNNFVKIGP
jgi:hypothetical protein